uniref:Uncharacterized protein n=1 Tax=Arundo donax TaxID=35708 RepID=A0A0A9EKL3_ARUDO
MPLKSSSQKNYNISRKKG